MFWDPLHQKHQANDTQNPGNLRDVEINISCSWANLADWIKFLVAGWTNPFEQYDRQNGFIFPK